MVKSSGGLAQLGEHLLCKQGVDGSIPSSSTKVCRIRKQKKALCTVFCSDRLVTSFTLFNKMEEGK